MFKSCVPFHSTCFTYWSVNHLLYNFTYRFKIKVNLQSLIMATTLDNSRGCHSHCILFSTAEQCEWHALRSVQWGCSGSTDNKYAHFAVFQQFDFLQYILGFIHLELIYCKSLINNFLSHYSFIPISFNK